MGVQNNVLNYNNLQLIPKNTRNCLTDPVSQTIKVLALIQNYVEDDHDGESDVKAEDGRCGVKIPIKCDPHPAGEHYNPRHAHGEHSY